MILAASSTQNTENNVLNDSIGICEIIEKLDGVLDLKYEKTIAIDTVTLNADKTKIKTSEIVSTYRIRDKSDDSLARNKDLYDNSNESAIVINSDDESNSENKKQNSDIQAILDKLNNMNIQSTKKFKSLNKKHTNKCVQNKDEGFKKSSTRTRLFDVNNKLKDSKEALPSTCANTPPSLIKLTQESIKNNDSPLPFNMRMRKIFNDAKIFK